MSRLLVALAVAVPWVLWAVVRGLGLDRGVLVPLLSFTPYVAATAWVPVVLALVLRSRPVALVALLAAGALVAAVAPRALGGPRTGPADGVALSVMTANLRYGHGDARAVMALVRRNRVDVLSLQELTPEAVDRLDAAGARAWFPHRVLDARPGAGGSGLMSRHPLADPRRPPYLPLAMPEARLEVPGAPPVELKAVHPTAPLRGDVGRWAAAVRALPTASADGPLRLLAGDFNATLDLHELRALVGRGYVDAADATGAGLQMTYPSSRPLIAIDHVLADRRMRVRSAHVATVPGSDHRALLVRLVLPRSS